MGNAANFNRKMKPKNRKSDSSNKDFSTVFSDEKIASIVFQTEAINNIVKLGFQYGSFDSMYRDLKKHLPQEVLPKETPQKAENSAKFTFVESLVIFLLLASCTACLIAAMVLRYSRLQTVPITVQLIVSGIFIVADILILSAAVRDKQFFSRYRSYYPFLLLEKEFLIAELSDFAKQSKDQLIQDLNLAVKKGLISEIIWGPDNSFFLFPGIISDDYLKYPRLYNHYFAGRLEVYRSGDKQTVQGKSAQEFGNIYMKKLSDSAIYASDNSISARVKAVSQFVRILFVEMNANPEESEAYRSILYEYINCSDMLFNGYINSKREKEHNAANLNLLKLFMDSLDIVTNEYTYLLKLVINAHTIDVSTVIEN
jgi:hypothetical protein